MNARRKKSGAKAVPARKAASARQSVRKASKSSSAKKPARVAARSAKRAVPATKAPAKAAKARTTILSADCTIEHAPALHEQLEKVLADRACVTLDFSAVKRCDTAGLQLLAAFIRERREAGLEVALTGASDNFQTTANVLGLAALFDVNSGAGNDTAQAAGVA